MGSDGSPMSDMLKHVVVADAIGSMLNTSDSKISNVGAAFALGMASHAIMDISEPDFTVNWFDAQQLRLATPFLGFQIGGIMFVLRTMFAETRGDPRGLSLRLAAIIGTVIPDVIDGIYSILNPHAWYAGQLLFPWHVRTWQVNPMSMWATTALTAAVLALRYLLTPAFMIIRNLMDRARSAA